MTTSLNQPAIDAATDEELASFLQSDDQRQFARLYDHFAGSILGILQRWVKNTETAENLLQDVFIKAWKCRHLYEEQRGRVFTWLYRIAKNTCIDYYRSSTGKKDRLSVHIEDVRELQLRPGVTGDIIPDAIGLRTLVNSLRQEEREVVNLVYFNGMTRQQAAEALAIPVGTVKTRINKAIHELRYFYKSDWKQAIKAIALN